MLFVTKTPEPVYFKVYNSATFLRLLFPYYEDDFSTAKVLSREASVILKKRLSPISSSIGVNISLYNKYAKDENIRPFQYAPFSTKECRINHLDSITIALNCFFSYKDSVSKSKQIIDEAINFIKENGFGGNIDCKFYTDTIFSAYLERKKKNPNKSNYDFKYINPWDTWQYSWDVFVPKFRAIDKTRLYQKVPVYKNNQIRYEKICIDSAVVVKRIQDSLFIAKNTDTILGHIFYPTQRGRRGEYDGKIIDDKFVVQILVNEYVRDLERHGKYLKGFFPIDIFELPSTDSKVIYQTKYPEMVKLLKYSKTGWELVQFDSNRVGYVNASYVRDKGFYPRWLIDKKVDFSTYDTINGIKFYPLNKDVKSVNIGFSGAEQLRENENGVKVYDKPFYRNLKREVPWSNRIAEYFWDSRVGFYRYDPINKKKLYRVFGIEATHISADWGGLDGRC